MKVYGQLEAAQLENVGSTPPGTVVGRVWFDTTDVLARFHDGVAVRTVVDRDYLETRLTGSIVIATGATLAVNGDRIFADTTAAEFTVTLPATPQPGFTVQVFDMANKFGTNFLTVARNGEKINGAAADMSLSETGIRATFIYVNATWGWRVF
jgi:hypothetical protein